MEPLDWCRSDALILVRTGDSPLAGGCRGAVLRVAGLAELTEQVVVHRFEHSTEGSEGGISLSQAHPADVG